MLIHHIAEVATEIRHRRAYRVEGRAAARTLGGSYSLEKLIAVRNRFREPSPDLEEATARELAEVAEATAPHEIIALLRECGLDPVANRIGRLLEYAVEDPDEPEMQLGSLQDLAVFLLCDRWLPELPVIGVDHEGLLTAEWRIHPSGGLILRFFPEGQLRYAGVVNVRGQGAYESVRGVASKPKALKILRTFTEGLIVR